MTTIPTSSSPIVLPDDNYGFNPANTPHLLAKYRAMDPEKRATILNTEKETTP